MGTKQIISCVLLTLAEFSISSAQPAQFDVFPLAPGLQYNYAYRYSNVAYWMGALDVLRSDSGLVVCTVKDSALVADTATVWSVEERSTLWHRYYVGGDDTAYWISTTTSGELIENRAGSHALRCSLLVWSFPLQYPVDDVYRYADSSEFLLVKGYFPGGPPGSTGYDSLWFSGSRGFYRHRRYWHGSAIGVYYSQLDMELLGSPTAVQNNSFGLPAYSVLFQNYPNPFNPSTKIQFTIVNRQLTIMKVYDMLGREVSTLVNEVKEPGTYTVQFDARQPGGEGSNLASGVYFYKLQSGDFVQTRKLLVVR